MSMFLLILIYVFAYINTRVLFPFLFVPVHVIVRFRIHALIPFPVNPQTLTFYGHPQICAQRKQDFNLFKSNTWI